MSVPGTFSEADRLQVLVGYLEKTCWWWKLRFAQSLHLPSHGSVDTVQ